MHRYAGNVVNTGKAVDPTSGAPGNESERSTDITPTNAVANEPLTRRRERFRPLYDELYPEVRAYCRRRVAPDDVNDLVAETMAVVWHRLDQVPPGAGARPWVYGVARNLLRNQRRKQRTRAALDTTLAHEMAAQQQRAQAEGSSSPPLGHDEIAALIAAVHALKPDDQELLRLAAWEELSHAEIAVVLDCSVNAVAIRLHRTRSKLHERLQRDHRWKASGEPRHVEGDGPRSLKEERQ